jgi:hypothetical protein
MRRSLFLGGWGERYEGLMGRGTAGDKSLLLLFFRKEGLPFVVDVAEF